MDSLPCCSIDRGHVRVENILLRILCAVPVHADVFSWLAGHNTGSGIGGHVAVHRPAGIRCLQILYCSILCVLVPVVA